MPKLKSDTIWPTIDEDKSITCAGSRNGAGTVSAGTVSQQERCRIPFRLQNQSIGPTRRSSGRRTHIRRMPLAVEEDVSPCPVHVRLLGADAVMFVADFARIWSSSLGFSCVLAWDSILKILGCI